jgi:hypothetical protein
MCLRSKITISPYCLVEPQLAIMEEFSVIMKIVLFFSSNFAYFPLFRLLYLRLWIKFRHVLLTQILCLAKFKWISDCGQIVVSMMSIDGNWDRGGSMGVCLGL